MPRRIAHVDMDAFFASVEERANPGLKGRPVLVGGGPSGREVITTASYPARIFGIRSGMPLREALRRCPEAVYLPVDPPRYISAAESLLRIFESFTPAVEPASIDEVFLDLSGLGLDSRGCHDLACELQKKVADIERLSCSIGLGSTKLEAKMASALRKPGGIVQLLPGDFEKLFRDKPVQELWGVGPKTALLLEQTGIRTISDLSEAQPELLEAILGVSGRVLIRMARGEGGGPVVPYYEGVQARSMGHEMTLSRDEPDIAVLERHLLLLSDRLGRRLRREDYAGYVIRLRLKWEDSSVLSRQKALAFPTDDPRIISAYSRNLLRKNHFGRPVRLIGVTVDRLIRRKTPYPLLDEDVRRQSMIRTIDSLRNRFGESSLIPAGILSVISSGPSGRREPGDQ